jgi:hypothetical protein
VEPEPIVEQARPRTPLHVVITVPHPKMHDIIRDRVTVLGPVDLDVDVYAHVVLQDKDHPASALPGLVRMALIQHLEIDPAEVGFTFPVQVELGWTPEHKKESHETPD